MTALPQQSVLLSDTFTLVSRPSGASVLHAASGRIVASGLPYAVARALRQGLTDHPDIAAAVLALHGEVPALTEDPLPTTGHEATI